jgi:hypothetical protein
MECVKAVAHQLEDDSVPANVQRTLNIKDMSKGHVRLASITPVLMDIFQHKCDNTQSVAVVVLAMSWPGTACTI